MIPTRKIDLLFNLASRMDSSIVDQKVAVKIDPRSVVRANGELIFQAFGRKEEAFPDDTRSVGIFNFFHNLAFLETYFGVDSYQNRRQ